MQNKKIISAYFTNFLLLLFFSNRTFSTYAPYTSVLNRIFTNIWTECMILEESGTKQDQILFKVRTFPTNWSFASELSHSFQQSSQLRFYKYFIKWFFFIFQRKFLYELMICSKSYKLRKSLGGLNDFEFSANKIVKFFSFQKVFWDESFETWNLRCFVSSSLFQICLKNILASNFDTSAQFLFEIKTLVFFIERIKNCILLKSIFSNFHQ